MVLLQEGNFSSGRLHIEEHLAACCVGWGNGEDEDDHHCTTEMGGEPGPTARAILFREKIRI
jgi:hypothetical protein